MNALPLAETTRILSAPTWDNELNNRTLDMIIALLRAVSRRDFRIWIAGPNRSLIHDFGAIEPSIIRDDGVQWNVRVYGSIQEAIIESETEGVRAVAHIPAWMPNDGELHVRLDLHIGAATQHCGLSFEQINFRDSSA